MTPILHLRTQGFRLRHLLDLLDTAQADGFRAVNLHWERFPHSFEPEPGHSLDDVRAVDARCAALGLEVIPTSHSFTHSGDLLRLPEFKALDGGGGSLELASDATLAAMALVARELQAAHPRARVVHMGGDEIFRYATGPAGNGYAVRQGRSALYIDFVNRLAAALRGLGLRLGIWSDMLIRYPERAALLDRAVQVWYWDYWGDGERSPFVSVGGGLMDTFVLDRAALRGDLRSLLFCHQAREGSEIPLGHWRAFARYWQPDAAERSVRSFPYCEWLRDLGLEHVACMLPIPEKGSFLPPVAEKLDHLRVFHRRSRAAGGAAWMPCCWGEHWPPIAQFRPAFAVAQAIAADPAADDGAVYAAAARTLGAPWTPASLRGWCEAGARFEFADLLDINWGGSAPKDRLAWMAAAGRLDEDCALAEAAAGRCEELLAGALAGFPADGWERLAVEDLAWRGRLQLACRAGAVPATLVAQGRGLRERTLPWFARWWPDDEAARRVARRYDPWLAMAGSHMGSFEHIANP